MNRTDDKKNSVLRLLSNSLLVGAAVSLSFMMAAGEAQAQRKGRQSRSGNRGGATAPRIYLLEKSIDIRGACEGEFSGLPGEMVGEMTRYAQAAPDMRSGIEFLEGGRFVLYHGGRQWGGRVISYARSERWVNASVNLTFEPRPEGEPIFSLSLWGCQGYAGAEACRNPNRYRPMGDRFMLMPAEQARGFSFESTSCARPITAAPTVP